MIDLLDFIQKQFSVPFSCMNYTFKMKEMSFFLVPSWPSFFIFLCTYTCLYTHFVSCQCLDDQKTLLLQFKASLAIGTAYTRTFHPPDKLIMWNEHTDCCQWRGVECDNSSGKVIGLDLSWIDIDTKINNSSSLFRLQFLKKLHLSRNNKIKCEIPSKIGKLSRLSHLSLTGFHGQVPLEISQLLNLVVLNLSSYQLYMIRPNLARIVQNLTNMKELYLDGVDISAMENKWGKALSSSLPRLQVLSMSNCNLRGKISKSLSRLRHISVIQLDFNPLLSGPVPDFLAEFTNLTTLSLSHCGLIGTVPENIFRLHRLTTLRMNNNELLQGTLPHFHKNRSLEELKLSSTKFSGILPSSISNLNRLRRIDLANCRFQGRIPSSIGRLKLLEEVYLYNNQFSGPIPSFSSVKNLKFLHLRDNNLNGSINSTNWGKLLGLEVLILSNNSIDGSIPLSLFSLPSLSSLALKKNKFSGQLNEFAKPTSSMLSYLDLSHNNLEGPVPKSVFRLQKLNTLDLSSNRFNGTLKMNELLQNVENLENLGLSHNFLSIEASDSSVNSSFPQLETLGLASCNLSIVPKFLTNQSLLLSLDLSMNQISGALPGWMERIISGLRELNLSCNSLVDLKPPLSLRFNASQMHTLDLHSNNLQGGLRIIVSDSLFYLDFSNNNLIGSIPQELCNATHLSLLNLEYNHLDGTVPDCLMSMTQLNILNLRKNYLGGFITSKFKKGCSLQTLNLNENFVQGQIPRSLSNCKELKVLDIGNNRFNDTFPCYLKRLSHLQVLILRSNNFHGTLLCPPHHSIWLKLQIVDISSNHFNGELKAQIFIKWIAMMADISGKQSQLGYLQSDVKFGSYYYRNTVAATFKGYSYELQYILTVFTSIDFSNNKFHGELPTELGNLNALVVLNLSHNAFSGKIPSSFGNLNQIQSLDLSWNAFRGKIPWEFANLNFIEYLNLSFNKLSGQIPTSTQLQSFNASSFEGNQGLYGPPLTSIRSNFNPETPSTSPHEPKWSSKNQIEWMLKGATVGFPVGITIFLGSLLFFKRYREWYCDHLQMIVTKILYKENSMQGRRRRSRQQRRRY
ncbi:receptor-like protein 34 [Amaranthus tricolor]|uniref:receptor-like protein 34 n=1 Tax=Amaranthus tricolor TaxID=29722 RepID=UPI002582DF60|nr:receptor-like protein 34 [Amaranthus tricolor]